MKNNKIILIIGLVVLALVVFGVLREIRGRGNGIFGSAYIEGTAYYLATVAVDEVITTQPAVLHKIIVGKDVGSSEIQISDHDTSAAGNIKFYITGSTLIGSWPIDTYFSEGITVTTTNQTNVTFIYSPR